jgi:hypothetical protein
MQQTHPYFLAQPQAELVPALLGMTIVDTPAMDLAPWLPALARLNDAYVRYLAAGRDADEAVLLAGLDFTLRLLRLCAGPGFPSTDALLGLAAGRAVPPAVRDAAVAVLLQVAGPKPPRRMSRLPPPTGFSGAQREEAFRVFAAQLGGALGELTGLRARRLLVLLGAEARFPAAFGPDVVLELVRMGLGQRCAARRRRLLLRGKRADGGGRSRDRSSVGCVERRRWGLTGRGKNAGRGGGPAGRHGGKQGPRRARTAARAAGRGA